MKTSKNIYLVGAGPGDIELLTLKAVSILKKADVVLFDALVNPEIFQFCKEDAIKVNVGKRKNHHLKNQEEINKLLVEYANNYEVVVRLKGGTPFVFGRGYEEVRAIVDGGFKPIVISGVSSTTSVPESFMLPPNLPIAILINGTKKEAQMITSTLEEINNKADDFFNDLKKLTPAIILVGRAINASNYTH